MPHDDGLTVAPDDLLGHAAHVGGVADEIATAKEAGDAVRMGADAYGQLCRMVPAVVDSLQAMVVDGVDAAVGSLHDTAGRLRTVAEEYRSTDEDSGDDIDSAWTGGR